MSLNNNTTSLQAILTTVNALPDKVDTSGTATAADIYTGKTATVNDAKITGTNPYNAATVDPAVTSALAAIAEKGVDTTGKGLGDIASLVAAIEAGGTSYALGSFTPAERITLNPSTPFTISHNLGRVPYVAVLFSDGSASISSGLQSITSFNSDTPFGLYNSMFNNNITRRASSSSYSSYTSQGAKASARSQWSETEVVIPLSGGGSVDVYMESGKTYIWVVI